MHGLEVNDCTETPLTDNIHISRKSPENLLLELTRATTQCGDLGRFPLPWHLHQLRSSQENLIICCGKALVDCMQEYYYSQMC